MNCWGMKMARLIDADLLMKFPIRLDNYDKEHGNEHFVLGIESVLEYAEQLPTVDAVPVVRCKDCKFIHDKGFCTRVAGLTRIKPDDFCSYGERKE